MRFFASLVFDAFHLVGIITTALFTRGDHFVGTLIEEILQIVQVKNVRGYEKTEKMFFWKQSADHVFA